MNFKISNFIQITYLQDKIDPYWRPSKLLFKNWVINFGVLLGLILIAVFSFLFNFIPLWRNILLITFAIISFVVGYLSCFNDIGDHSPAGILWATLTGIYFFIILILLKLILDDVFGVVTFPMELTDNTSLVIILLLSILVVPFFGILGRFVHESAISLRVDRYREVEKIKISFILLLLLQSVLLVFNAFSYQVPINPFEPNQTEILNLSIPTNGWQFMVFNINLNLLAFILVFISFLIVIIKKWISNKSEEDFLSKNMVISLILSIISIIWIVIRLIQFNVPFEFNTWYYYTNVLVQVPRDLFLTLQIENLTLMFVSIYFILYSLYELEQIDYKLYRRWS